jgi:hypothetical protein
VTHRDPRQTRRDCGVTRTHLQYCCLRPSLRTRTILRILLHSQTARLLGWHEGTEMCDERSGKARGNSGAVGREGEEDEGRGRTHRGIFLTTFGYAGGNTAIVLPFWKKWLWHEVSPAHSGTLWNTVFGTPSRKKGSSAKTRRRLGRDPIVSLHGTWAGLKFSTIYLQSQEMKLSSEPPHLISTQWRKHPKAS